MNSDLAPTQNTLPALPNADAEGKALKSDFTPYISLLHGVSKAVMNREPRDARPGSFLIAGRIVVDEFIGIPIQVGSKPRASYNPKEGKKLETFDPDSPEWAQIKIYRNSKNKEIRKASRMGVESLVWLPEHKVLGIFSFSNTARKAHEGFADARLKKGACIFRSKTKSFGDVTYFVPVVEAYKLTEQPALPAKEAVDLAVTQFFAYTSEEEAGEEGDER